MIYKSFLKPKVEKSQDLDFSENKTVKTEVESNNVVEKGAELLNTVKIRDNDIGHFVNQPKK